MVVPLSASAQLPALQIDGEPVGCIACDGPAAFGAIMGLGVFADGALAVLDRDEPLVRVFARDGSVETTFGRRGRGPGEIARPASLAVTASGAVWVADFMGTALTEYQRDGTYVERLSVEGMATGLRADPSGQWLTWQVADWQAMAASVRVRSPDGEVSIPLASTVDRFVRADGHPAPPGLLSVAPSRDGWSAVGYSDHYHIEILDPEGDVVRTLVRDIDRTERTEAEISALSASLARGPGGRSDNPEAGAPRPEVDPLRPHFLVSGLTFDDRDRLWVRTARGGPERTTFDVFGAGGEYLGEVAVEAYLRQVVVAYGFMLAIVEDPDLGIQRVHRWRIMG